MIDFVSCVVVAGAYVDTLVIQRYIEDPFLLEGRKFDYRCYLLVTVSNSTEATSFVRAFSDGKGSGAGADSARSPLLSDCEGQGVGAEEARHGRVATSKKQLLAFIHNGYVRSAGREYNAEVSDRSWAAHITNFSVQREVRASLALSCADALLVICVSELFNRGAQPGGAL